MSYFYPGLGAIREGSRWYFSVQLVTCALFPSQGQAAWGGMCADSQASSDLTMSSWDSWSPGWVLGLVAMSTSIRPSVEVFSFPWGLIECQPWQSLGTGVLKASGGQEAFTLMVWQGTSRHFLLCCWQQCALWMLGNGVPCYSKNMLWKAIRETLLQGRIGRKDKSSSHAPLASGRALSHWDRDGCHPTHEESLSNDLGSIACLFP